MIRIKVSLSDIDKLFRLSCVDSIRKTCGDRDICVRVRREWNGSRWRCTRAYVGDVIECRSEDSETAAVEVKSIKAVINDDRIRT